MRLTRLFLVALSPRPSFSSHWEGCTSDDPAYASAYSPAKGLVFYWTITETTLEGKLVHTRTSGSAGYLSVGPSPNGKMIGAEVILGLPAAGTVEKYKLESYASSGVQRMPANQQTLTGTSISSSDTTTELTFVKLLSEPGELDLASNGATTLIFAVGFSDKIEHHRFRSAAKLDLKNCGAGEDVETKFMSKAGVFAHAALMIGAWMYVVPSGILTASFKNIIGAPWMKMHIIMQVMGTAAMVCALIVIILTMNEVGRKPDTETATAFGVHVVLGFVCLVLAALQVAMGFLRPKKPTPGTKTSSLRTLFEYAHKFVGHFSVVLAILAVFSGIEHADDLSVISSKTPFQVATIVPLALYVAALVAARLVRFVLVPNDAGDAEAGSANTEVVSSK